MRARREAPEAQAKEVKTQTVYFGMAYHFVKCPNRTWVTAITSEQKKGTITNRKKNECAGDESSK